MNRAPCTAAFAVLTVVLAVTACRGANTGAIATEVAAAAAVEAVSAVVASRPASGPVGEGSHISADLNDPPPSRPVAIDLEHARAVVVATDSAACWPLGIRRGPRDVQVTFRNDGTVVRVAVPRPQGLATFDEPCVAGKLKDLIVDPFLGPDVIVGVAFGEP